MEPAHRVGDRRRSIVAHPQRARLMVGVAKLVPGRVECRTGELAGPSALDEVLDVGVVVHQRAGERHAGVGEKLPCRDIVVGRADLHPGPAGKAVALLLIVAVGLVDEARHTSRCGERVAVHLAKAAYDDGHPVRILVGEQAVVEIDVRHHAPHRVLGVRSLRPGGEHLEVVAPLAAIRCRDLASDDGAALLERRRRGQAKRSPLHPDEQVGAQVRHEVRAHVVVRAREGEGLEREAGRLDRSRGDDEPASGLQVLRHGKESALAEVRDLHAGHGPAALLQADDVSARHEDSPPSG
jgi:hypothetical protein